MLQAFNFSKINFSAPPRAAADKAERGNNKNGNGNTKLRRVSVRNNGTAAANSFAHYLSPIVAFPAGPVPPTAAAWNASQAKPALPNNMQKKLTAMARSGPRYTSKNRKLFKKWNKNIESIEHPGLSKRKFTAKRKRSASRRRRRHRN